MQFILAASRNIYPNEFMGLLRMEGDVITEVLVLPQSIWGESFASISSAHIPIDNTIVGSVHSHPSPNNRPSETDLVEFGRSGAIHMIAGYPYRGMGDIACYDHSGNKVGIEVVYETGD